MYSLSSQNSQSWLPWFLRGILVLGFLILLSRLVDLQLIRGGYFRNLSEENRIRRVPILAPRGKILARGGEVLIGNRDVKKEIVFDKKNGFVKIDAKEGSVVENIISEPMRLYEMGSAFAHAGGYVGEVSPDELGKIEGECPEKGIKRIGDYIGRSGLEKEYECNLFGINGEVLFEVDARSKSVRILGKKDPIPGEDIKTTIDIGLQKTTYENLLGSRGAVIVTDPNGEVLAFASSPAFDPNLFVFGNSSQISDVLNDKSLPLFNRSMGGLFHPGSVFKPLVAVGALENGSIDTDFKYQDTGAITIKNVYGSYSYKNWYFTQYGGAEGVVGIERALARSTDTFFYKVGETMGAEKLTEWASIFGLDKKSEIDIPGEISGLVPNPDWKLNFKGERWFLGDTYNVSIGQGDLAVTPLAISTAITSIANGGNLCRPHFKQSTSSECNNLNLKYENLEVVREGMDQACSTGGTAYPFFDFFDKYNVKVACKTGTAQNVHEDPHAWFVAFAPSEKPEIIVTVLVENGGEGSKVAAPMARKIMDFYFEAKN